jgi:DNA repair protein RadC
MKSKVDSKTIKAWPLSESELLAILLRSGTKGKDATALGRELMIRFGNLRGLFSTGSKELQSVKGLGPAKSAVLLAARELVNRYLQEPLPAATMIREPEAVMKYLYGCLRDQKREIFKVLYLNKAHSIIRDEDLFQGTVDQAVIYVRELVKSALEHHATALILVHNHPSGRVRPSREDLKMTRKIELACQTVCIKILDHIIVGNNRYFSFRENRLLRDQDNPTEMF